MSEATGPESEAPILPPQTKVIIGCELGSVDTEIRLK